MGSGKGRARRAQAKKSLDVVFNATKWYDFVQDGEVEQVRVDEYYLGGEDDGLDEADYERIYSELFADAVVVGAVSLPAGYAPDDFEFRVGGIAQHVHDRDGADDVRVALKSNPQVERDLENS